jgi:ferrous iron transport protein A
MDEDKTEERILPLSELPEGSCGIVHATYGGRGMLARLSAMGLTVGAEITVAQNSFVGPVVVDVRGVRLAIGRGMATRIMVRVKQAD